VKTQVDESVTNKYHRLEEREADDDSGQVGLLWWIHST